MKLDLLYRMEHAASGLIATLLDAETPGPSPTHAERFPFRRWLFEQVFGPDADELLKRNWVVATEDQQLDITLRDERNEWLIFIENKVRPSSTRRGQIVSYYRREKGVNPARSVAAVFLTPRSVGKNEAHELKTEAAQTWPKDRVVQVDWFALSKAWKECAAAYDEKSRWFVEGSLDAIQNTIEDAATERWPREGARQQIFEVAALVQQETAATSRFGKPWPSEDYYVLATERTNLTLWFYLRFGAQRAKPHLPVLHDGKLSLKIEVQIRVNDRGKKDPRILQLHDAWRTKRTMEVPSVGVFALEDDGWFHWRSPEGFAFAPSIPTDLKSAATAIASTATGCLRFIDAHQ